MKKWQKTFLTILASSLAMGWIAQGEATLIKLEGANITQAQPVKVIIMDPTGNTSEQTANYDPSTGGIDIDTSWAGPRASIFIPSLGIGYVWYNGYWVNQEGYYWNGTKREAVPDMQQWKTHWTHYWRANRAGGERGGEGWQRREGGWQGREGGYTGAYQGGQAGTMRSAGGYQGGQYGDMSTGADTGAMRSTSGYQGGDAMGGSMSSPSGQAGAMRSSGYQGAAPAGGSMNSGASRSSR